MIALVQGVQKAAVTVENETIARIDQGLLIFLGIHSRDTHLELDLTLFFPKNRVFWLKTSSFLLPQPPFLV